jgi:hypothetical protein
MISVQNSHSPKRCLSASRSGPASGRHWVWQCTAWPSASLSVPVSALRLLLPLVADDVRKTAINQPPEPLALMAAPATGFRIRGSRTVAVCQDPAMVQLVYSFNKLFDPLVKIRIVTRLRFPISRIGRLLMPAAISKPRVRRMGREKRAGGAEMCFWSRDRTGCETQVSHKCPIIGNLASCFAMLDMHA